MKGQHDYSPTCMCYRCKGIRNSPTFKQAQRRIPNLQNIPIGTPEGKRIRKRMTEKRGFDVGHMNDVRFGAPED